MKLAKPASSWYCPLEMFPFAQSSDDPPFAWSQESTRTEGAPVSMLTRLANAAKGRKSKAKKDDDDDNDDLPGPNAVVTLFPFFTMRLAGPAMA